MDKKPLHLGLYSGPPRYTCEEAVRAQWERGPKVLGPSIATLLVQRSKASPVEKPSERIRKADRPGQVRRVLLGRGQAQAISTKPNDASSLKPNHPPEATRASLEKNRERIETADLSKVKVW